MDVLVGTFPRAYHADTEDTAIGVYGYRLDETGRLLPRWATPALRAGWVEPSSDGRFLYAVAEVSELDGAPGGGVSAYALTPEGLALLGRRRTQGGNPCHCTLSPDGEHLLVSTFHGGTVEVFPVGTDGALGERSDLVEHAGSSLHPRRQTGPHAHQVVLAPEGRHVLVPDLGTDQVLVHGWDGSRLTPHAACAVTPGSGPRHLALHPSGRWGYLLSEMSATIDVLAWDGERGLLAPRQRVDLLPEGFSGLRSGAEVLVHPAGRWVYATTRSHGSSGPPEQPGLDALVWYDADPATGTLTWAGRVASGGAVPRTAVLDPAGRRLLVGHQGSGTVVTFDLDPTGAPAPSAVSAVPVPVCLRFSADPTPPVGDDEPDHHGPGGLGGKAGVT